jgi:hypothetical protein
LRGCSWPPPFSSWGNLLHLYNESDGPALDFGLEQRLKRLDPRLKIVYSSFALDPQTGYPIIDSYTGKPVPEPAHHLWCKTAEGWQHVDYFPMAQGGFQHINAHFLELNKRTTETIKPALLYQLLREKNKLQQEIAKRKHTDWRQDRAKANSKRIGDLVFEGKSGYRQAKPSSYAGQTIHSTPGQVLRDAREDGWELE